VLIKKERELSQARLDKMVDEIFYQSPSPILPSSHQPSPNLPSSFIFHFSFHFDRSQLKKYKSAISSSKHHHHLKKQQQQNQPSSSSHNQPSSQNKKRGEPPKKKRRR